MKRIQLCQLHRRSVPLPFHTRRRERRPPWLRTRLCLAEGHWWLGKNVLSHEIPCWAQCEQTRDGSRTNPQVIYEKRFHWIRIETENAEMPSTRTKMHIGSWKQSHPRWPSTHIRWWCSTASIYLVCMYVCMSPYKLIICMYYKKVHYTTCCLSENLASLLSLARTTSILLR